MKRGARASGGVRSERRGEVVWLTLARPKRGNRFDPDLALALADAAERADEDDVRCVVLAHEGDDFCLGLAGEAADWPAARRYDFVAAVAAIRAPVVAAIEGRVEAEGVALALAADLRLVGRRARFRLPQVERGGMPAFGATQRLPRLVGSEAALRMILLGDEIDARRAVAIGLATRVVSRPRVAAEKLAAEIAERAPIALRFAKEAVVRARDLPLDDGARLEHDLYALLQTTADRAEGVRSFLEKRKPRFRGS